MPEKRKIQLVYGLPDPLPASNDIYAVLWRYRFDNAATDTVVVQLVSRVLFNKPVNPGLRVPVEVAFEIGPNQHVSRWKAGQLVTELLELNDAELSLDGLLNKEEAIKDWDERLAKQYRESAMAPPAPEDSPKMPPDVLARYA